MNTDMGVDSTKLRISEDNTENILLDLKIHHIGIVVKELEKNIALYRKLGYHPISDITIDQNQKLRIVFLQSGDRSQTIELMEALDESSSVYGFKGGYHHICYEVDSSVCSPEEFATVFKELKVGRIFTKPMRAPAIEDRLVIFACLINGALVEFLLGKEAE